MNSLEEDEGGEDPVCSHPSWTVCVSVIDHLGSVVVGLASSENSSAARPVPGKPLEYLPRITVCGLFAELHKLSWEIVVLVSLKYGALGS